MCILCDIYNKHPVAKCGNMSIAILKNIISMFVHIGEKFGNENLSKRSLMSPNMIYKNLVKYIWVSAFTMGYGTGGGDTKADISITDTGKGLYEPEKGDFGSFFDVLFTLKFVYPYLCANQLMIVPCTGPIKR